MIIKGKHSSAFLTLDNFEATCISQIYKILNHPTVSDYCAIMPDAHAGKGICVGFTSPLTNKGIVPNFLGVDIGCGMLATNIGSELKMDLKDLDKKIREKIPMGTSVHSSSANWVKFEKDFPWTKSNVFWN